MITVGLFDSGFGGLTVAREVKRQLPEANIEFYGDNGRNPYGPLSKETITQYSRQILGFLGTKGVDVGIIACNTATAAALEAVKDQFQFPVLGVIGPGARGGKAATKNKKVGVIATQFTIESGAYDRMLKELDSDIEVTGQACPKFTTLVEQGKSSGPDVEAAVSEYLATFKGTEIDTLILGCTHYPVLIDTIRRYVEGSVNIVDPAVETVAEAKAILKKKQPITGDTLPTYNFYTSGDVEQFTEIGSIIFGQHLQNVVQVTF
ncbi:MAG: glutamate racemase [bacterium]